MTRLDGLGYVARSIRAPVSVQAPQNRRSAHCRGRDRARGPGSAGRAATSEEAQLSRLQSDAPDVAALVVEGTLTLAAGLAELDERARKKRIAIEQGQDAAEDIVPT